MLYTRDLTTTLLSEQFLQLCIDFCSSLHAGESFEISERNWTCVLCEACLLYNVKSTVCNEQSELQAAGVQIVSNHIGTQFQPSIQRVI